jgi:hypothetical protein
MDSNYAGEPPADAGINAELESRVTRDDNVFSNNARAYSDFIYEESALINLWKSKQRWNLALQYRPTLLHYQEESSLNSVDQNLTLAGKYDFTQRFRFQGTETFSVITGLLGPSSDEYFSLPTSSLPSLNATLVTPTARTLSEGSEGHIDYDVSPRGSFDLTGGYTIERFTDVRGLPPQPNIISATLLDMNATTGGVSYQYRVTQRFTLGGRYDYQYFHYGLGGSDESHTAFVTTHWDEGSHVGLDLYAGPSYSTSSGVLLQGSSSITIGPGTLRTLSPAAGGTFSLRSDQTVFDITAQHVVTSGGGLLMTVTTTNEGAEVRRRLGDNWDLVLMFTNARSLALQNTDKGKTTTETAGAAFERSLFDNLSLHLEYDYLRQRVNEFVPLGTNVNTNQLSISVFYRLGGPHS